MDTRREKKRPAGPGPARRLRHALPLLLLVTGACSVRVSSDRIGAPIPPEGLEVTAPDSVTLLGSEATPASACVPVAELEGRAKSGDHRDDLLRKLREEASLQGANTVHLQELAPPSTGDRILAGLVGVFTGVMLGTVADVYLEDGSDYLTGGWTDDPGRGVLLAKAVALDCPQNAQE